jgi:hypothetical protein
LDALRSKINNINFRDGDCMKVILSYLRTDELDIPPNIRSYDLDRESLFYNIELPKANARNRHRRKIELRKNGIYTSDASFFYFKVIIIYKSLQKIGGMLYI